jgi:hypothetical protein
MTQGQIRQTIMQIVHGNIRYANPADPICREKVAERRHKGEEGYSIQSAEEVLDDIIIDLTSLQDELRIESSFQSANI